jgi:hypothetical protein
MEVGKYDKNKIDFRQYYVTKFNPHLFDIDKHPYSTCGSAVLSLLTGESPTKVEKSLPKGSDDWTDKPLINYLINRGYEVKKVTQCDVTEHPTVVEYPIKNEHVLIVSKLVCRDEGTWTVVHNQFEYHNFEINMLKPLEYLNNPIMSAYVVFHKKWK